MKNEENKLYSLIYRMNYFINKRNLQSQYYWIYINMAEGDFSFSLSVESQDDINRIIVNWFFDNVGYGFVITVQLSSNTSYEESYIYIYDAFNMNAIHKEDSDSIDELLLGN